MRPIYMDHHATTPVDQRVLEAMLPYFTEEFGNASSIDHEYGSRADEAVQQARSQVARLIRAKPEEIIFTSGATESNNLAILGVAEALADKGRHIITAATEHPAILDPCLYLERHGWQITRLPVDRFGLVDLDALQRAIRPDTVLISIMTANNEIGTIAPIKAIGEIAREHGVLFHTDATQAAGYLPLDVQELHVDLLSLSGHKMYGPKGIGALYVRRFKRSLRLEAQIRGGGHERGLRSGTLNVPGIVGLGKAAEIASREMRQESERLRRLRDRLWEGLRARVPGIEINGHPTQRLPHNLNIYLPGVNNRALLVALKHELAFATGSACATTKVEPSHVILALGYPEERAKSSIRLGLGRSNTEQEIDRAVDSLAGAVEELTHKLRI
ncbi:cysteine desulfurase family protein [Thermogemmatispora onikobensis]|uniref:cysteine desulfurase family protein n=1 Tax=Thermogemmatispora onikobensis TaxID=732234 RepID=UPI0008539A84|nr:cysteine desulfurase family protein [Thermogemmatispora onikobensis]